MGPTFDSGIPRKSGMSGVEKEKDEEKHVLKLDVNETLIQNRSELKTEFNFIKY